MPNYRITPIEQITAECDGDEEIAREILASSCETCGSPHIQAGEKCSECTGPTFNLDRATRRWRQFMHGVGAVHSFSHGWLSQYNRRDRNHLDP